MTAELATFPVTQWDIGPVPALNMIVLRPHFISHPLQRLEEAQPSRYYAMPLAQVEQLIDDLQKAAQKMKSAEFQAAKGPQH